MINLGNIAAGQTINFLFSTNDGSGAAVAPTTAGTVSVYKNNDTAQTITGVTYTPIFDGVAGVNLVSIATTDSFYAAGNDFTIVLSGAVIDGETVNAVVAAFSVEHRFPVPADNADALLDLADGIESGVTLRQALRAISAVLAGKVSGAGSGVELFKGLDGSTSRVEVTADAVGNRTNLNYTLG